MNVFNFVGNIGRDGEVRQAGSATLCEFPVAVKSGYGEREKANWIRCQIWGKRAEGELPKYLVKGQAVAISGEMAIDEWDNKEGEKRTTVSVNVNSLDLVGGKKDASSPRSTTNAKPTPETKPTPPDDFDQDRIPF